MKMDKMSQMIVQIMDSLSSNDGFRRVVCNDIPNPMSVSAITKEDFMNQSSLKCRIKPTPFDVDAVTEDGTYIRVYCNDGDFNDNEVMINAQIHIDIIVSKKLWLINDGIPKVRPYEIAGRILEIIGQRAYGKFYYNGTRSPMRLKFNGFSHIYVNREFDAIRLYAEDLFTESSYAN